MTRARVGLSLGLLCVFAASACSSKSVDDAGDTGGMGTILTAGSGGTGAGGSGNATAGNAGTVGGEAGATGGSAGSAASAGTTGAGTAGTGGGCAGTPITCVDAETARGCDPTTNTIETVVCSELYAEDGLVSNGCTTDELGSGCTLDDFADMACVEGVPAFATCGDLAEEQLLDAYIACFHDTNGLHTIIPCFADFVDDTVMPPTVDCEAAELECFPE